MSNYIGVDVGTGSARACITNKNGEILAVEVKDISKQELQLGFITQSSNEIWDAILDIIKRVIDISNVDPSSIDGIAFDATCSLVVFDKNSLEPIAVGPNFDDSNQNIILWMDHRAASETDLINSTNDKRLKYVGGKMSVEFELPKIKWLKDHLSPETFHRCVFLDLADFLTYKATGKIVHSFSSAVCKQGLLPTGVEGSKLGWSKEFLEKIGLEELSTNNFEKLGGSINLKEGNFLIPGDLVGHVDKKFAGLANLPNHCVVGTGVIDAYSGWVGTVASDVSDRVCSDSPQELNKIEGSLGRIAVVSGTSTCHIVLSKQPLFISGVWGPYRDVLAENMWATEGGQSFTGALLDNIIETHPAYQELERITSRQNKNIFVYLDEKLEELRVNRKLDSVFYLTKNMFIYGDYYGNRSPLADPLMSGMIIGQTMDSSINDLAIKYLAACEFIALQTRHIIDTLVTHGHGITAIYMSGGHCKNKLLMELISNCCVLPLVLSKYIDSSVVFGAAILGSVAAKINSMKENKLEYSLNDVLWSQMKLMTPKGTLMMPKSEKSVLRKYLQAKYEVYLDMIDTNIKYRKKMEEVYK
ncbi:hypothetical protein TPHA_0B03240 [Tetrapisispora phaffii CBS 4417]|uniref:Carbohydrate kinase FGGY C-terminal domain-containing protein n=1 Tax=Tetrapisispora phaffii (strain ATCC 24235 / CBS 4417 / NBRC 1672 / NRRL Y-8282 / UCD 70-5) TaxID=1071381 RepID=G8BPR5_TETPH|nr:hypothetical protein TPHA_0B03240 [Tetrapisispora phaffii CBS 4417]CCE61996.1 hypothetical protein TPHA_0B03240 [Tetrapisispora phaffii CBS 4417]